MFVDVDVHVAIDVDGRFRRSGIEGCPRMRLRPRARQGVRQRSRESSPPEDNAADRFSWNSTGSGDLNFAYGAVWSSREVERGREPSPIPSP